MKWLCSICKWLGFCGKDAQGVEGATEAVAPVAPPAPPAELCGKWRMAHSAVVGDKHLKSSPPVPCQDAAFARAEDGARPCAFVADGAGSAELSHMGAGVAVLFLRGLCVEMEADLARLLDGAVETSDAEASECARKFVARASEGIRQLAGGSGHPFKKFHCTLLGAVVGTRRVFWFHVGDGHVVVQSDGKTLKTIGAEEKSGFANVTTFVREDVAASESRQGFVAADNLTGIALMTDGAAEKLVSHQNHAVAGAVNKFLADLRGGEFDSGTLHQFLSDVKVWKPPGYTGDDKGMALLSRVG